MATFAPVEVGRARLVADPSRIGKGTENRPRITSSEANRPSVPSGGAVNPVERDPRGLTRASRWAWSRRLAWSSSPWVSKPQRRPATIARNRPGGFLVPTA